MIGEKCVERLRDICDLRSITDDICVETVLLAGDEELPPGERREAAIDLMKQFKRHQAAGYLPHYDCLTARAFIAWAITSVEVQRRQGVKRARLRQPEVSRLQIYLPRKRKRKRDQKRLDGSFDAEYKITLLI